MSEEDIALEGIRRMEQFYHRIGMPINMRELGISPSDQQIRDMAESCNKAVGGRIGSAMVLHLDDMINIYNMAKE